MTWLGLKTNTLLGVIGTSSPVLGLRPRRPDFFLTMKVPNEESFTFFTVNSMSVMISRTDLTRSADSVRESPTWRWTASLRSVRVKVFPTMSYPCQPGNGKVIRGLGQIESRENQ